MARSSGNGAEETARRSVKTSGYRAAGARERHIEQLGRVTLAGASVGELEAAFEAAKAVPQDSQALTFGSHLIAGMLLEPKMTPAEVAALPESARAALFEFGLEADGLKAATDASELTTPQDRFHATYAAQWRDVARTLAESVSAMAGSLDFGRVISESALQSVGAPISAERATLSKEALRLMQVTYNAFSRHGKWPYFDYVDRTIYQLEGVDAAEIAESMPDGLVIISHAPRDDEAVKLTMLGVSRVAPTDDPVISCFLRMLAWFCEQERSVPTSPTEIRPLNVTSEQVDDALGISVEMSLRALVLNSGEPEPWTSGGGISNDGSHWDRTITRGIREYRKVTSLADYLAIQSKFHVRRNGHMPVLLPRPSMVRVDPPPGEIQPRTAVAAFVPNSIFDALKRQVSDSVAEGYAQAKQDIEDPNRRSWAGTAHEIRECIGWTLRTLAPDDDVSGQPWFKQETNTIGPTHQQRAKYILGKRHASSHELQVIRHIGHVEEMTADLVRDMYARASDAAHRHKGRDEVRKIMGYFEAFARDLLDVT